MAGLVAVLAATAAVAPAAAQSGSGGGADVQAGSGERPQADPGRYVLAPAGEIFLRLDRQTGRVAECRRAGQEGGSGAWRCQPVADAQLALEEEIARLSDRVAALQAENAALRGAASPDGAGPGESVPKGDAQPRLTPEEERDLDRALDFTEQAMRRFFGMMKTLREEYEGLRN